MVDSKPESTSYYPLSFGTIEVSSWPDGGRSARLRFNQELGPSRVPPVRGPNESEDSFTKRTKNYEDFTKFGRVPIYSSDVYPLLDVLGCIRPDTKITIEKGGKA